jgi:preprotein translocase subunit SecD
MTTAASRRRTPGAAALRMALALVIFGSSGCSKAPKLRLTYQVDVAHAYDGDQDVARVLEQTRKVIAHRLQGLATVITRGQELIVELATRHPDDRLAMESIVEAGGRLEIRLVDDVGGNAVFSRVNDATLPPEEGIALYLEMVPNGLDEHGNNTPMKARYARMVCKPPKHEGESARECLARFRAWASSLDVGVGRRVGFETVTEQVPGTEPPQFESVGWRTHYLIEPAELTNESVSDAQVVQDHENIGRYYVALSLSSAGGKRLEEITGANVNRRMAILVDDVVVSAPNVRAKIGGGRASITMGAGDPERQLRDAKALELALKSGALPAPLRLVGEETLPKGH